VIAVSGVAATEALAETIRYINDVIAKMVSGTLDAVAACSRMHGVAHLRRHQRNSERSDFPLVETHAQLAKLSLLGDAS